MRQAAGLLLRAEDSGRILLLLRRDGTWDFPGGILERGEDALDAALRELVEETGFRGPVFLDSPRPLAIVSVTRDGPLQLFSPPPTSGAVFAYATILGWVLREFGPRLDAEHILSAWTPLEHATALPLHPGVAAVLSVARDSASLR